MKTTLFVPSKLTFSEKLWCFNLALLVGALSQKRLLQKGLLLSTCFVIAGGKFNHHKWSENVNFEETNNAVFILASSWNYITIKTLKGIPHLMFTTDPESLVMKLFASRKKIANKNQNVLSTIKGDCLFKKI